MKIKNMSKKKLAINGGSSVTKEPFPDQITIGTEEQLSLDFLIRNVINHNALLSNFRGNWIPEFWGGTQIQALEKEWSDYFNVKHSISVNSCTSALQIACGAIGLGEGDEVIVTPWSMSCSATAPLVWNAIPIFADIDKDNFCLDPKSVEEKITKNTKAIIYVDLFGSCGNIKEIMSIAHKHNLIVIEDAAQAPGAFINGMSTHKHGDNIKYAGTIGHIGCYSFTQGKHLTSGEGGMIVTDDLELAMRCRLIRNHAEAVLNGMDEKAHQDYDYILNNNMLGFNMRMIEIQACIIREQLRKLNSFVIMRQVNVKKINNILEKIPFIKTIPVDNKHSYYVQAFKFDKKKAGVHRNKFIAAVKAELTGERSRPNKPMLGCGYIQPLYLMPLFQKKRLYGGTSYPFSKGFPIYNNGICLVAERLWSNELFISMYHSLPLEDRHLQYIKEAFYKVSKNIDEIK